MRLPVCFVCLWIIAVAFAGGAAAQSFSDPFAYCAAIGTIDRPDSHFKGQPPLAEAAAAFDIKPELLDEENIAWRCYDGAVYACAHLNSPICGKADVSRVPTPQMTAFCRSQPDSEVIPLVVMGHEHPSMYDWTCRGAAPAIARQVFTPDPRGYPPGLWKKLSH